MRSGVVSLTPKLLTEFVGTFIFLSTIALSGAAGPLAPIVIGSALMVMVYMGGHISGGHYNPAVSFGAFLRGAIDALTMVTYWVVQLVAGVLAFVFGYLGGGPLPYAELPQASSFVLGCVGIVGIKWNSAWAILPPALLGLPMNTLLAALALIFWLLSGLPGP